MELGLDRGGGFLNGRDQHSIDVFHQIWLGKKQIPGKFREWAEGWADDESGVADGVVDG